VLVSTVKSVLVAILFFGVGRRSFSVRSEPLYIRTYQEARIVIRNMVAVTNGKGGVLKTSLVANLAGAAALSGWDVLAIDLDPQGNLARDFGYADDSDQGAAMANAVIHGAPIEPMREVRPRLDVIAGGERLEDLTSELDRQALKGNQGLLLGAIENVIAPISDRYNLILVDTPPGEALLQRAVAHASHFALVPTQPDDASIDGLNRVAIRMLEAHATNPDYDLLGVVLGPMVKSGKKLKAETEQELEKLLQGKWPIFESTIRLAQRAAVDCRREGKLAHEYEQIAEAWKAGKSISERIKDRKAGKNVKAYSSAAGGLAEDYQLLADEILSEFTRRLAEPSSGAAPILQGVTA